MAAAAPKIVRLRIELADTEPSIWRVVELPADFSLRRLHNVIQVVFLWLDYHLHQFEIGDRLYGAPEYDEGEIDGRRLYSDKNITLAAVVDGGIRQFVYRYDFGDDWEHLITVEQVTDPGEGAEYPILVEGARRAPPEDCGGPPGFELFLEAMADQTHEDHASLTDWYGGAFDPEDLDLETVKAGLGRIGARSRKGPAKGSRKA